MIQIQDMYNYGGILRKYEIKKPMVYTNKQIAEKANTYVQKVSMAAKAHSIGTKVGNQIVYDQEECRFLLKILNAQKVEDMKILKDNLILYGPLTRNQLAHRSHMHWERFNRILADLTFYDPKVCEDDECNLYYLI